jgi:hypothetical protein
MNMGLEQFALGARIAFHFKLLYIHQRHYRLEKFAWRERIL